jgi:protein ImuB
MFAALHLPDFPAAAAVRGRADLLGQPCAILAAGVTDDPKGKLPLASLNRAARLAGIRPGWPLNRALVRCPDLRVLPRDPPAEAGLLAELIELAESLTPDFEITRADLLILDLPQKTPLTSLYLAEAEIWHARASTPDLAGLAARHELTQGRDLQAGDLVSAPLDLLHTLATAAAPLELLEMWGLKTLGEFMALPRQALTERLGPQAGRWHDLLHGKTCRLLRLHRPPESLVQKIDFEDPIISLEPLVFTLKRLLHTLSGRLAARHLAAACLDLRLILETGAEVPRRIRLPEPQNTVEGMLAPLQTWLDSLQLDAAITALELDAETTFASASQREWFGRQLPQPERWAETLARLEALLGPGRVGIPVPPASHAPDAFTLRPAAGPPVSIAENPPQPACPLPLHRYRPPREIAVAHESRGGHPLPLALLTGPFPGRIIDARGPYPASGAWWEAAGSWQRLEWDVQVASRQLLRLVFQTPDRWQLEGIYQ